MSFAGVYDVRSRVVHGEVVDPQAAEEAGQRAIEVSLRAMLELYHRGGTGCRSRAANAPNGSPSRTLVSDYIDLSRSRSRQPVEGVCITVVLDWPLGVLLATLDGRWGKKWGKVPHRSQPIPADLDFAETA
jgi:hypothetical protein